jgi:hypothetical protein
MDLHEKTCSFNLKTPSQRFKEKLGKAHANKIVV